MTHEEIIDWCSVQEIASQYLVIPDDIFLSLTVEDAKFLSGYFNNNLLIKLPTREIEFFEWLKIEDPLVWDDLWKEAEQTPYIISITFLPLLTDKITGFPICDLLKNDNYYFTDDHIIDKEAEIFTESSKQRFLDHKKLTPAQALMMQISIQPTDIWHFAYYFKINLNTAKETALQLADDKMLIHIKEANYLSSFIRF